MKDTKKVLESIGLTKSEINVYLALLKLGSSTKKDIVKESAISASKLYEVTDKLINKGLVSYVRKNKVLHFSAAPPEQVIDFLDSKKEQISTQADEFSKLLPGLKALEKREEPEVEVFRGWKGMRTVYKMMLNYLKPGEECWVMGATSGEDKVAVSRFFEKFHKERRAKGIIQKILIDNKEKAWALKILKYPKYDKTKFIDHAYPQEVNIWGDNVMIVLLTKTPVVTLIKSKVAANGFRNYFKTWWKLAEK